MWAKFYLPIKITNQGEIEFGMGHTGPLTEVNNSNNEQYR